MSKSRLAALRIQLAAVAFVSGCGVVADDPGGPATAAGDQLRDLPAGVAEAVAQGEPVSVIVALAPATDTTDPSRAGKLGWGDAKQRLVAGARADELAVEQAWDELPLVQLRIGSLEAASELLARPELGGVYAVDTYQLTDAESYPLIGQPAAAAAGKLGTGTSVAVLDTGANYTRAELGSCTSPGVPASCRVAVARDFAPSDGSLDDNGHGTNVSSITAGVAPGAKILALDVFTGGGASSTDIISAINWAVANKATYGIASMNLSLGGGSSTVPCSSDAMGIALGTARAAGIAPVVASGNNGYTNAISAPGCAPAAISVGAVYDANVGGLGFSSCQDPTTAADKVTCFSNSASFLTVLAPGALIAAGGYTMAGTSQAAPHVAGAMAVLRAAFPAETVDQLVARMTSKGKPVADARNGITKPRLDLFAALGAAAADVTPPTGTLKINAGVSVTRTAAVTLAIAGADASGVASMCVSNTTTCTTFVPYATSLAWTLAAGDGAKTVTLWLRDRAGNTTTLAGSPTATIRLDATPPTNGTVAATPGNATVALAWSGFADTGSGIASYRVVGAAGTTAPATCDGATSYAGTATSFTHAALVNGTTYSYRICAVDAAGNSSTGVLAQASPRPESVAPIGSISINGGAARTRTLAVTLTLSATDASGVTAMCISEGTVCTAFVPYAATRAYTFAAGEGTRKVTAWYRDKWGNTSAPVAATIVVDTTAPTTGAITATPAVGAITLSWPASTDTGSGIASYRLVGALGTVAPAAGCATGTLLQQSTALSYRHVVAARATWSYRVCAVDGAGNPSAGAIRTATAL